MGKSQDKPQSCYPPQQAAYIDSKSEKAYNPTRGNPSQVSQKRTNRDRLKVCFIIGAVLILLITSVLSCIVLSRGRGGPPGSSNSSGRNQEENKSLDDPDKRSHSGDIIVKSGPMPERISHDEPQLDPAAPSDDANKVGEKEQSSVEAPEVGRDTEKPESGGHETNVGPSASSDDAVSEE